MKKLILIALLLILVACKGLDSYYTKEAVLHRFPKALKVEVLIPCTYFLVVAKDSTVFFVLNKSAIHADHLRCDSLFNLKKL